jgi:hypothetical protein
VGGAGSDVVNVPLSVECKRTVRYQLRGAWITQARSQAKREGRPWILVIAEHNDRRPIVVLDFAYFVRLAAKAGLLEPRCKLCGEVTSLPSGYCPAHAWAARR